MYIINSYTSIVYLHGGIHYVLFWGSQPKLNRRNENWCIVEWRGRGGEGYVNLLCPLNHSWSLSPESGRGLLQASGRTQYKFSIS